MFLMHPRDCQPLRDINDPKHWRHRAKEMRALAEGITDAKTRRTMNRLAEGWDQLADRAEGRAAKNRKPARSGFRRLVTRRLSA